MNKLIRLSPTGIEYGDYAWNFASGCGNNVDGKCKGGGFKCWAYSISQRFEGHYPNGFKPTIYPEALLSPLYLKKPSRILCAFMGDLFWDCPEFATDRIIDVKMDTGFIDHNTLRVLVFNAIKYCPRHTFIFLTKQSQNLAKFSPFPENCYVGVTVTNEGITYPDMMEEACRNLAQIKASVKYLSFEPLLSSIYKLDLLKIWGISWVIIGAQTKPYTPPKIEWVREIVEACDKAGIPVFLKDNLKPLFGKMNSTQQTEYQDILIDHFFAKDSDSIVKIALRQEMPEGG